MRNVLFVVAMVGVLGIVGGIALLALSSHGELAGGAAIDGGLLLFAISISGAAVVEVLEKLLATQRELLTETKMLRDDLQQRGIRAA